MNLTFPIADWLFGTSDLDRGLLGHAVQRLRYPVPEAELCAASAPARRGGGAPWARTEASNICRLARGGDFETRIPCRTMSKRSSQPSR